jgi:type I restriction enzyme S subunit
MRSGWRKHRIGDLGRIVTGRTPPTRMPYYFGERYPFITPSDMDGRKKADSTQRYLSEEGAELLQRNLLPSGSVAVSCIGWQMGKSIMTCRPSFTNQQLNAIIPNEKIDGNFLYYALLVRRDELLSLGAATGVRTPILNKSAFSDLDLLAPSIEVQRKIAAILSSYDDLIENNTRRIAILEDMAQAIYREWFVHFRFPGHEGVRMVESELGPVPEGWEVVKLSDITTKIGSGATPRGGKSSYKASGIALIRSLNVFDYRFESSGLAFIDEVQAEQLSNVVVQPQDILLNITGASVARCCMVPSHILPARVNQHVSIVRVNPDKSDPFYVLNCMNSYRYKEQLLSLAQGGATREALTKEKISDFKIPYPLKAVTKRFASVAEDLFRQQETLQLKTTNLRQTRDLLLSRLVSGELDVSELDIDTGGSDA